MNEVIEKILRISSSLPRAEKAFADALIESPEAIERMTLAEIARESGSSEASIIRFCKRMGYTGYTALKEDFILANKESASQFDVIRLQDDMSVILNKLYRSNLQILSETLAMAGNEYEEALEAILGAKSIHFFAVGDAMAVVKLAYIKFRRLGVNCSAEEDVMLQMIAASNMTKNDVAVAVSYEGRSRNVVEALKIAKQCGAKTISITRRTKSPLLDYTDIRLLIAANDLTVARDKVTRRISDQFILEALYLGYESRIGKDYKTHMRRTQKAIDSNKI